MKPYRTTLLLILGLALAITLYFNRSKPAAVADFPIPPQATYVGSSYYDCDNCALPSLAILANGWQETANEGESTVYEKNGHTVIVMRGPGEDGFTLLEGK